MRKAIARKFLSSRRSFDYEAAFCRNVGLISPVEQRILQDATIGIVGMGGVGGVHLMTLARMGIGGFHIADGDSFELANFNRQFGADVGTLGHSKTEVMQKWVRRINPNVRLTAQDENLTERGIDLFLDGVDLVVDGLDAFATEMRYRLFTRARERRIPVITAGPIGFSCSMLIFTPTSMKYADYFDYKLTDSPTTQFVKFLLGLSPKLYFLKYLETKRASRKKKTGPSVASSVQLCAGFAATEALKILLGRGKVFPTPYFHCYDAYTMQFKTGYLPWGNRNPWQKIKFFFSRRLLRD